MSDPRVMLVMIVRDEAPIIRDRLRAVRDDIDAWCIVDTGSVDDTVEIAKTALAGVPGVLTYRDWTGFADARTHAVECASDTAADLGGEWWALLLDADTVCHLEPGWRKALVGDAVEAMVHHGALRYSHPRLLRLSGHRWRWRGVVHEYLEVPHTMKVAPTELVWVEHGSGGARERNPNKFRDDAELLGKVRAEGNEPDLDARYCFYEAQSWRDAGEIDRAVDLYMLRGRMGGWHGEVFMAWLTAGGLLWEGKQNWPGANACWVAAWATDPTRAEALIGLASLARAKQFWVPCFEYAKLAQRNVTAHGVHGLFGDNNILWRADYELAVAGSWVASKESRQAGRLACLRLINGPYAPDSVKTSAKEWLKAFYPPLKAKR